MRQRGVQSRKGRSGLDGGTFGAPLGSGGGGDRFWPTVAMIAIVIATAGWTTVAVLALSGRGDEASPSPSLIAAASDEPTDSLEPIDSPVPESHVSPALEALLPKTWETTPLSSQSVAGDTLLSDDEWSTVFTTFLAAKGKTPVDLIFAQAYDPTGAIDLTVGVYKISGASAADVRKTLIDAWKASYPGLTTKAETIGGKKVNHGVIPDIGVDGYWYEHNDIVYEVETSDAATATKALTALP